LTTFERAVTFPCQGDTLVGILHPGPSGSHATGILIVVGGPQYRGGSHRQFVLMAREFARAGYPVLRFDYRGMGDSDGTARAFTAVGTDIRCAVDVLTSEVPGLEGVVIFGLCDAASAALLYCGSDTRVQGLMLANPWVRSEATEARAYLKHYYGRRLLQASFWRKVLKGEFGLWGSLSDLIRKVAVAREPGPAIESQSSSDFVARMRHGLESFARPVLFLISDRDLTAAEFTGLCRSDAAWARAVSGNGRSVVTLVHSDHTFSSAESLRRATDACLTWLQGSLRDRREP
jgi:exosortase A-associated hydrolase 1